MKILLLFLIIGLLFSCTSTYKWSDKKTLSHNFKDGVFVNTNNVKFHSLWEMFWLSINSDVEHAEWPKEIATSIDTNPVANINDSKVRVTYINHATFLIQTAGFNILTDPVFSERTSPVSFAGPKRVHPAGIKIANLPKVDIVVISHDHYDHLDLESLEYLIKRDNPKVLVGLGVGERIKDRSNVTELDWWEGVSISEDFKIFFLDVQHFSGRTLTDRNTTLWGGFLLQTAGKNIYFGGDSGYADHYTRTFQKFGPMDISFIPIGAYAPRKFFEAIHLNPTDAVQAHLDLHSKLSIGMHYGTFQLTAEPYSEPIELLNKAVKEADMGTSEFITLKIGEPIDLDE